MQDETIILKGFGLQMLQKNIWKDNIPQGEPRDKPLYYSSLGTPVFSDLRIEGFSYTSKQYGNVTVPTMVFTSVLMTVDQSKHIIKTDIQGRNGSVKEYISDGDYTVNIKGVITAPNGIYPYDAVVDLKKWLHAPMEFRVASRWLQNLDIDVLVIENYSIPQMEGGYSYQLFDINCISDLPFELNL